MAEKMSLSEVTYSAELFGFSPLSVQLEFERKLSSVFEANVKSLQSQLGGKCKNDSQKEAVQKSIQQLKEVYQKKSRKMLEEFNSSISELLKVPPHVLLPADEVHRNSPSEMIDIEKYQKQLIKTQLLIALAQKELKVLNKIQSSMQDVSECRHFVERLTHATSEMRDLDCFEENKSDMDCS